MNFIRFVVLSALSLASVSDAMPRMQHLAVGEITAVDRDKIVLARTPGNLDGQSTFVIESGRTRFHENGKKSSFEQLRVGHKARIFFKRERGMLVAISVSWKGPSET